MKNKRFSFNLIVAYDLTYNKTKATDYTKISSEIIEQIESSRFIGRTSIKDEIDYLAQENIVSDNEAHIIFGKGYAARRNAVLYNAIKYKMDY
ncbi:MAG: hypothetical protein HGA49_03665 [Eubacteriaceae bacterium]|nr:hypothetical protein [Eubacteriaceae bacterium]